MMTPNNRSQQITMRSVLFLITALVTLSLNAIPAKPGVMRLLTLTDGTTVEARLVGDEHGHYWLGTNGKTYHETTIGNTFAEVDLLQVKQYAQARRTQANARRVQRMKGARRAKSIGDNDKSEKKGIIILVNFDDVEFQEGNNGTYFQRIANEEGFHEGNFVGSVRDYFLKQSEGNLILNFDVVGPYTVSQVMSYYGGNNSRGNDLHPAEMVIEACKMADEDVDFSKYDWNGNNEVDQVYVVYAGMGENEGGGANTIWPHEWTLSSAFYYNDGSGPLEFDGVRIDTYACGSELNGMNAICGIGTMCHEFSHCLGYPDYYDTDYSGGQGMGWWDLMDSGSYGGNGYRPCGYTSYERWMAGWLEPIELTATTQVENLKALQDEANAYIIYNGGNRNEFFLFENRQQIDWDLSIPASGLLILHCDYDQNVWNANAPNDDPDHQRMTWIPADGIYDYGVVNDNGDEAYFWGGMMTDTYPYINSDTGEPNNAFSFATTPAANFYNKNSDGTYSMLGAVKNITQNTDGTVSFLYKSAVPMPEFSLAAGSYTEPQTVNINSTTEGVTIYYTIDGTEPTVNSMVYFEPISIETNTVLKAVAISDEDEESSKVTTAKYFIHISGTETPYFRRATSIDDLAVGERCIIACGEHGVAVGKLEPDENYLESVEVEVKNDVIMINENVLVFTLSGDENQYAFQIGDKYLYATATRKVGFSENEIKWRIETGNDEVFMTYSSYGSLFFSSIRPRFNVYTATPNENMLLANIYVEYEASPIPVYSITTGGVELLKDYGQIRNDNGREGWFTIDGRRLSGKPTKKGVYIHNGKVVIR